MDDSMDFKPDPEDDVFRMAVRAFVTANLPADIAERMKRTGHPQREDVSRWMSILHENGWSAVGWPSAYSGVEWTGMRRMIFEEECLAAFAPPQHFGNIHNVGPVLYTFGADWQKSRFIEPLLKGDEIWCQGFSEPNAGSDLASLTTRAVKDGDSYVISGQKTWTSDAHEADWMFALVRTDASVRPQAGLSFILLDMKSPGITVHPIDLIDGSHVVSNVFFDEVRVPADNLVGAEGSGWDIAKFLLANERAFSAEVPATKRDLARLLGLALRSTASGERLWDDPNFRAKIVKLRVKLDALEYSMVRALTAADHEASPLASLLKIPGSELRQAVSELLVEAAGSAGLLQYPDPYVSMADLPGPPEAQGISEMFAYRRATTIYGGSNEIQRDIIAKTLLRL
jgi:alkylation response protein AidB-like acyl-CoA dehydrogenase